MKVVLSWGQLLWNCEVGVMPTKCPSSWNILAWTVISEKWIVCLLGSEEDTICCAIWNFCNNSLPAVFVVWMHAKARSTSGRKSQMSHLHMKTHLLGSCFQARCGNIQVRDYKACPCCLSIHLIFIQFISFMRYISIYISFGWFYRPLLAYHIMQKEMLRVICNYYISSKVYRFRALMSSWTKKNVIVIL